jgi:hypothetical protein
VQNKANEGCGEQVETGACVVIYIRDDMTLFSGLYFPEFLKRFSISMANTRFPVFTNYVKTQCGLFVCVKSHGHV